MKTSAILLVASIALGLAACGKSEPAQSVEADAANPAESAGAQASGDEAALDAVAFAADTTETLAAGGGCSLDAVDGAPAGSAMSVAGEAVLDGWAVAADPAVTGDAVLILVGAENRYAAPVPLSLDRPDVAEALQREDARTSGFKHRASFASVAPGQYAVHVRVGGMDCDTGKALVVAGG
jgi:hypothetical protein